MFGLAKTTPSRKGQRKQGNQLIILVKMLVVSRET